MTYAEKLACVLIAVAKRLNDEFGIILLSLHVAKSSLTPDSIEYTQLNYGIQAIERVAALSYKMTKFGRNFTALPIVASADYLMDSED